MLPLENCAAFARRNAAVLRRRPCKNAGTRILGHSWHKIHSTAAFLAERKRASKENCGAPPGKSRTIPQAAAVLRRKLLNSYKFPIIFDLHLEFYGQIR